MSDEFGNNIEDLDEEMEIITMIDDETEEEIEFVVIDRKKMNDTEYILVIESKDIRRRRSRGRYIKGCKRIGGRYYLRRYRRRREFEAAAGLFEGEDYEVEY